MEIAAGTLVMVKSFSVMLTWPDASTTTELVCVLPVISQDPLSLIKSEPVEMSKLAACAAKQKRTEKTKQMRFTLPPESCS